MSLLPTFLLSSVSSEKIAEVNSVDVPREYEIDFTTGQLTGRIVEGVEAIKTWVWLCLQIERYRFPIYTWQYGAELEQYIGKGYSQEYLDIELKSAVEDALKVNPHITGIENFSATVDGDKLTMSFKVNTDLGGVEVNV